MNHINEFAECTKKSDRNDRKWFSRDGENDKSILAQKSYIYKTNSRAYTHTRTHIYILCIYTHPIGL